MKKILLLSMFAVILIIVYPKNFALLFSDNQQTLKSFLYQDGRAEDEIMDPLIIRGEKIASDVLFLIEDRELPYRRYAISYLGLLKYKDAIPILESMALDASEEFYIRADALEAIYAIDQVRGKGLARQLDELAENSSVVKSIMTGTYQPSMPTRSFIKALYGWHE